MAIKCSTYTEHIKTNEKLLLNYFSLNDCTSQLIIAIIKDTNFRRIGVRKD